MIIIYRHLFFHIGGFLLIHNPHHSFIEFWEFNGLEEITGSLVIIAFHGIFIIGSGKNNGRWTFQGLQKRHAVDVGHIDIQKKQVNVMIPQVIQSFDR